MGFHENEGIALLPRSLTRSEKYLCHGGLFLLWPNVVLFGIAWLFLPFHFNADAHGLVSRMERKLIPSLDSLDTKLSRDNNDTTPYNLGMSAGARRGAVFGKWPDGYFLHGVNA